MSDPPHDPRDGRCPTTSWGSKPRDPNLETTRLLQQIRRFIPPVILAAAVLSCQGPEPQEARTAEDLDVTSSASVGIPFTPSARPQTTTPDAGTVVLGFEGFPSVTPLPADAYAAQGVTVSGAIVLTAPLYNWFSRPPHSGSGVITGDIDPPSGTPVTITLVFDQAYTSAEAFITSTQPVELRCTDAAGVLVGSAYSRAPNLVGGGIYPPNDHVQVTGAGIRGCTITGPSNRFVVDDVTLGAPATLTPQFTTRTRTVEPVLTQVFDARAGTATNSRADGAPEQPRSDTVSLVIGVDTSAGAAPSDTFWLETSVQPGSGYHTHDHATRPRGRLWQPTEAAAAAKGPGGDSTLQVLIPDSGKARVIFRSSGVSGIEVIRLHRGSPSGPVLDSAVVTVKIDGLVRMARDLAGQYEFKDQDSTKREQGHGNFNDGVVPAFRDSVVAVFADYMRDSVNGAPRGFLRGQTRFVITDASLPWGGLLDIASTPARAWRWPHFTHRTGTDMDIRTHYPQPADSAHQELTATMDSTRRNRFIKLCAGRLDCRFETPYKTGNAYHIHLKPATAHRSGTH